MKNVKKLSLFTLLFMSIILLNSCAGKQGDPGPSGAQGTQGTPGSKGDNGVAGVAGANGTNGTNGTTGPKGETGNANVMQYTFGPRSITGSGFIELVVPLPTSIMGNCLYNIYVQQGSFWYQLPGYGAGGSSSYRVFYDVLPLSTEVRITKVTGTGTEYFVKIRILVVPSSSNVNLARTENVVDFKNYEAVRQYYQLPE